MPLDLVAQLRDAGCFRTLVPRRFGGAGLELADHMTVVRELARADGSVGWTVMIGSAAPAILGKLPAPAFAEVYAGGPDVVLAGAFNPTGVATPVDGGFRVSGRWAFASGCQHADWFVAHCFVDDGRMPPIRMMVLPAADIEIVDTWEVSGLCGTGSHDFTIDDEFVPAARTFAVFEEGGVEGPLGRIPELSFSSLAIANVALGIAEGALGEVTTLATAKVPMFADVDAGVQSTVPQPARRRRRPPRCGQSATRQHRRIDLGDRRSRSGADPHPAGKDPNDGHVGHSSGRHRRRHRLHGWRWERPLLEQPAAATAARRPRHHPALRSQAGHVHARRRRTRRPRRRHNLPVGGDDGAMAADLACSGDGPLESPSRLVTR